MAKKIISGTLKKVFAKELPKPDEWENLYRLSICITPEDGGDDVWVGLGSKKRQELGLNLGSTATPKWKNVGEGSTIEVVCTTNGDYLNAKNSDITVIDLVEAPESGGSAPATRSATSANSGSVSGGVDWARKDAGAAASASVDKAIAYLTATAGFTGFTGVSNKDYSLILAHAGQMQEVVKRLADDILNPNRKDDKDEDGDEAPVPVTPKKPKPKPAREVEPAFADDDIPF